MFTRRTDAVELKRRLEPLLFDRSPCQVAVIDNRYRIVLANSAFTRAFGSREGEACHEVYKGRATRCERCPVEMCFDDGKEHATDEQGIDRYNKIINYQVSSIPLMDAEGKVEHVLQISTDRTHVIEMEQGLKQAERLATVGLTAAGLAHTIKNILSGLDGGSYMVNSSFERNDQARLKAGWEMVQRYIEQVSGLVQNLLSYSKPREPSRERVEPVRLVENVIRLYGDKARMANVDLGSKLDGGLESLMMDREAMHASLSNLVSNALDACTWDPDLDKKHRILVAARSRPQGGVVFEVTDNGPGISEENQRKVLKTFFTSKGVRGTGLGLLLTKKAVQEHNGTIDFVSKPGEGTTFRIEIPSDTTPPSETFPAADERNTENSDG
jgi:signal transduction histidine kinase